MKKKIIIRALIGAPLGLAINYIIAVAISLTINDGGFYPVVPELTEQCGSEISAVLLQTVCLLLCGAVWGGMSAIWEAEKLSLLLMTVIHLIVCSAAMFPAAYLMRWMPHNAAGILGYFGIFLVIYTVIWISQYSAMKRRIRQINSKVHGQK